MIRRESELVAVLRVHVAEQERRIADLEDRNAELQRHVDTLCHDIRSPLVSIEGFLSFLRRDALALDRERMEHDIERICHAAGQISKLLDRLSPPPKASPLRLPKNSSLPGLSE